MKKQTAAVNQDEPIDNAEYELDRLQEAAKLASIYHGDRKRYQRNPNLTHLVHASLHVLQLVLTASVDIFHHVHHARIRRLRKIHPALPEIPRESSTMFFVYPICILMCLIFAILWFTKKVLPRRSQIDLVGCALAAALMFIAGIFEMVQVEKLIDISKISDEDLRHHPIFFHNFIMCILSIFSMTTFLIHVWLLSDYCRWTRKQEKSADISIAVQASTSSADVGPSTTSGQLKKFYKKANKRKEKPGDLDPIPFLESFPSVISIPEDIDVEDEPAILYCCFVDWYNYLKRSHAAKKPTHEFQVIHVV